MNNSNRTTKKEHAETSTLNTETYNNNFNYYQKYRFGNIFDKNNGALHRKVTPQCRIGYVFSVLSDIHVDGCGLVHLRAVQFPVYQFA